MDPSNTLEPTNSELPEIPCDPVAERIQVYVNEFDDE